MLRRRYWTEAPSLFYQHAHEALLTCTQDQLTVNCIVLRDNCLHVGDLHIADCAAATLNQTSDIALSGTKLGLEEQVDD